MIEVGVTKKTPSSPHRTAASSSIDSVRSLGLPAAWRARASSSSTARAAGETTAGPSIPPRAAGVVTAAVASTGSGLMSVETVFCREIIGEFERKYSILRIA